MAATKGTFVKKIVTLILPALVWSVYWAAHTLIDNSQPFFSGKKYDLVLEVLLGIYLLLLALAYFSKPLRLKLQDKAPLISAALVVVFIWELLTLKFAVLPLPYFPSPGAVVNALISDWKLLGISTLHSLRLLASGYFIGLIVGLPTGIFMGWSPRFNYWLSPVLRFIGPIPATAWIPIAMAVFPTSFTASIFIIALSSWFPISVMSWSGVSNVSKSYYEVARTLGGSEFFLITRVAVPAAFPSIFVGLFMGLGISFVTLVVGEMLGVKAGLGWYMQWAQGWAEYVKVYAALIVMAVIFSGIITLLFRLKDRILVWQKGLIKW